MKIGILQTGTMADNIIAKHGDTNILFMEYLAERGFEFETYAVVHNEFPQSHLEADGWIVKNF